MVTRRRFLATLGACLASSGATARAGGYPAVRRQIPLPCGRRLCLAEYGDPGGWPIFYFHGLPASGIEAVLLHDVARSQHCRILAVDRPGIGLSDYQSPRTLADWPRDVVQLADQLQLTGYSVMGFSSGGPYAVACASGLPNEPRLRSAAVVSGVGPLDAGIRLGRCERYLRSIRRHPGLARLFARRASHRLCRRPDPLVNRFVKAMSEPDHCFFSVARHRQLLIDCFLDGVRCGECGLVSDAILLGEPWCLCLPACVAPVHLWYGACDVTTPTDIGYYLARRLPASRLRILPGKGHYSMLAAEPMTQILAELKSA